MIALLDIIQHIDVTTQHAMEWTEPEEMMSKNTMQIRLGVGHRNKLADLLWCSLYLQQSLEGVVMVIINRSSCLDNLWCNTWRIHLSHMFLSTPHPTLSLPQNNFSLHLLVKVINHNYVYFLYYTLSQDIFDSDIHILQIPQGLNYVYSKVWKIANICIS